MDWRSVGIIGYGSFGSFLHTLIRRFLPHIEVRVYSLDEKSGTEAYSSLQETCAADVVVFSVPIHAFEDALIRALPLIPRTSVIVDVATIKTHTVRLLETHASDRKYLATHPMFGPESYEKRAHDVSGFRIVVSGSTLSSSEYDAFESFCLKQGFKIIPMTPDAHDKQLAETLFLTHFIGQIVARAGFTRTDMDTVSFELLMNAVDSVKNDTALFKDVFLYNPYCAETLRRFEEAERDIESHVFAEAAHGTASRTAQ